MAKNEYDLIVIGAGSAGSTAATTAAGMGKRVALIERDQLGGTQKMRRWASPAYLTTFTRNDVLPPCPLIR